MMLGTVMLGTVALASHGTELAEEVSTIDIDYQAFVEHRASEWGRLKLSAWTVPSVGFAEGVSTIRECLDPVLQLASIKIGFAA
ncbi:hypothetical protein [Devosia sp. RR2S18]|uniref:hypothetical protein n=1 Tax=Devosia rhizosphaerae TaxID=3049774 RepID=UPI00253FC3B4|nr:hypothetical protein [Devosia sp. RR2S18]WIJ23428.1 hypothetical protein QOV41_10030 [Devosia sp. RR2S18]